VGSQFLIAKPVFSSNHILNIGGKIEPLWSKHTEKLSCLPIAVQDAVNKKYSGAYDGCKINNLGGSALASRLKHPDLKAALTLIQSTTNWPTGLS